MAVSSSAAASQRSLPLAAPSPSASSCTRSLRWSQSFSLPSQSRQKSNVTQLMRRKSAAERLEESKHNYIKSPMVNANHESLRERNTQRKSDSIVNYNLERQLRQLIANDDDSHLTGNSNGNTETPISSHMNDTTKSTIKSTHLLTSKSVRISANISRSKSDASHRLMRHFKSKDDCERFFETLGLETNVWDSIRNHRSDSLSTPAHCIVSNDDDDHDHDHDHDDDGCGGICQSISSSQSSHTRHFKHNNEWTHPIGLTLSKSYNSFSQGTSIVEKNARIIKWLCNCRKASQS